MGGLHTLSKHACLCVWADVTCEDVLTECLMQNIKGSDMLRRLAELDCPR